MPLPVLAGERLCLELPLPREAQAAADYCRRNRERLAPHEPRRDPSWTEARIWQHNLARARREARADRSLGLMLRLPERPGEILGRVTLSAIQRGPFQAANLGYSLDASIEGRGLMSEALVLVLDYAFGPLALHRIQAACRPDNGRSLALLARLGFRREGFAPDYLCLDGRWCDHLLLALHAPEWASARCDVIHRIQQGAPTR
jgi:ribosomal-protein-alanine N-acetyltransferase